MNIEKIDFNKEILKKVFRSKRKLEDKLKVKIKFLSNSIEIKGSELNLYLAKRVLEAIEKEFPISVAFLLLEDDYTLEEIPIKTETRKKNLERIRGRIIGKQGKTLKVLSDLSECFFSLHENIISIIGTFERIKVAENAVKSIIHGSKQANVYSYLEKARAFEPAGSIEIKPEFKAKKG